jgi:hypothetical protein
VSNLDVFREKFLPNIQTHNKTNYNQWKQQNPGEASKWEAYRDVILSGGSPVTPVLATKYGMALVAAGMMAVSSPAPPAQHLTGTHFPDSAEYATIAGIGYEFAVTYVGPTDTLGAKEKLDAAKAAGIKLIIGVYAFGGPEPYVLSGGNWTISADAQAMLNYFESRSEDIIALFVFNEPYWIVQDGTGRTDLCGAQSAELRSLRTAIKGVWPAAKIYHDIGWPTAWAPGGTVWSECVGQKYADQSGVADYVGIWDYPFISGGVYRKHEALARFQQESSYVVNSMGAIPVWLGQSFGTTGTDRMPTAPEIHDWNCAIRAAAPSQALISWYVWKQLYPEVLVNHPEMWSLTVASAC